MFFVSFTAKFEKYKKSYVFFLASKYLPCSRVALSSLFSLEKKFFCKLFLSDSNTDTSKINMIDFYSYFKGMRDYLI